MPPLELDEEDDALEAEDDALEAEDDALEAEDDALDEEDDALEAEEEALEAEEEALEAEVEDDEPLVEDADDPPALLAEDADADALASVVSALSLRSATPVIELHAALIASADKTSASRRILQIVRLAEGRVSRPSGRG